MKKLYFTLLLLLLMPALAIAQDNKAISATWDETQTSYTSHYRLRVPVEAAGLHRNQDGETAENFATSYSVGMWFNLSAYHANTGYNTADSNIVLADLGTEENSNANGNWCVVVTKDGEMKIQGHGGSDQHGAASAGINGTIASSVSLNEWHYLLMSFDNENLKFVVYLDNSSVYEKTMTKKVCYDWSDDYDLHFIGLGFSGMLDEVNLFNAALTSEEAQQAYYYPASVASLTGNYTFDEEVAGATGNYANSVAAYASYPAVYNLLSGSNYSEGGLVPVSSQTPTSATLSDGRTIDRGVLTFGVPAASDYDNIAELTFTVNDQQLEAGQQYQYATGTEITVSVTPAAGYTATITVDGTPVQNGGTFKITSNLSKDNILIQTASDDSYATLNVTFAHATVSYTIAYVDGTPLNEEMFQQGKVFKDKEMILTIEIPANHSLASVSIDGTTQEPESDGTIRFTVTEDATVSIDVTENAKHEIYIIQSTGGTITLTNAESGEEVTDSEQVYEGTVLNINTKADSGYKLKKVNVNGSAYSETTLTVERSTVVSAEWEENTDPEYCILEGNAEYGSDTRGITSLTVSDNKGTSVSVEGAGTSATHALYTDQTATVFNTIAGATVTIKNNGSGNWMSSYLYVDYGQDGVFDVDNTRSDVNGDLVSHTGYNPNDSRDPTTYSDGTACDWGSSYSLTMPSFTIPEDTPTGYYRVRHKVDWNSVNPCGRSLETYAEDGRYGNWTAANGGGIIDFTMFIQGREPREVAVKANDETIGSVEITSPAGAENNTITTDGEVTVTATPIAPAVFVNWTNQDGDIVSTDATYVYGGFDAVTLTANFGYTVTYSASGEGTVAVTDENSNDIVSGTAIAKGTEITMTFAPEFGKVVSELTVNNVDKTSEIVNNVYTFTVAETTVIDILFDEPECSINVTTNGNCEVVIAEEYDPDTDSFTNTIENGSTVEYSSYYNVFIKPAENYTISITVNGNECQDDTYGDLGLDPNFYYSTEYLEYGYYMVPLDITGEMNINVTSTAGIDGIDADSDPNAPVEYFNLQGVKVNAENLVPGFYVRRQGSKATKVFVNK